MIFPLLHMLEKKLGHYNGEAKEGSSTPLLLESTTRSGVLYYLLNLP